LIGDGINHTYSTTSEFCPIKADLLLIHRSCPKEEKGTDESWAGHLRLKKFASLEAKHRHCSLR